MELTIEFLNLVDCHLHRTLSSQVSHVLSIINQAVVKSYHASSVGYIDWNHIVLSLNTKGSVASQDYNESFWSFIGLPNILPFLKAHYLEFEQFQFEELQNPERE